MSTQSSNASRMGWTKTNTAWVFTLFGTAIGAGVLFLPINAGLGGFWPLLLVAILAFPMTYLSHRGLSRFVLASPKAGDDITLVASTYFGKNIGLLITILYFVSIFPIVLVYGVSLTNTVDSFLVNQLEFASMPRVLLSGLLIGAMLAIYYGGEKVLLAVTTALVYPLALVLLFISIYLIPQWNLAFLSAPMPSFKDTALTVWLTLPVIVFSFNHAPIISYFSLSIQREYGEDAEPKASQILFRTAALLWFFVMLFVFSCVMSLTPADLLAAKEQNVSILTYLANHNGSPFISYFGPLVAFCAIASSFFGHYAGAVEGLVGLLTPGRADQKPPSKLLARILPVAMFLVIWVVAILNPSVLKIIESFSGPVIAIILFLMPVYAVYTVPQLKKYAGGFDNLFVLFTGILAISSIIYALI